MSKAHCEESPRDRDGQRRIILWSLGWAAAILVAVFVLTKTTWLGGRAGAALAVVVPTSLGVATAWSYRSFLRRADELRSKIEVEALALAYSVGVVGGLSYWLLEVAGVIEKADVSFLVALMLLVHPLGVVLGRRRYS